MPMVTAMKSRMSSSFFQFIGFSLKELVDVLMTAVRVVPDAADRADEGQEAHDEERLDHRDHEDHAVLPHAHLRRPAALRQAGEPVDLEHREENEKVHRELHHAGPPDLVDDVRLEGLGRRLLRGEAAARHDQVLGRDGAFRAHRDALGGRFADHLAFGSEGAADRLRTFAGGRAAHPHQLVALVAALLVGLHDLLAGHASASGHPASASTTAPASSTTASSCTADAGHGDVLGHAAAHRAFHVSSGARGLGTTADARWRVPCHGILGLVRAFHSGRHVLHLFAHLAHLPAHVLHALARILRAFTGLLHAFTALLHAFTGLLRTLAGRLRAFAAGLHAGTCAHGRAAAGHADDADRSQRNAD